MAFSYYCLAAARQKQFEDPFIEFLNIYPDPWVPFDPRQLMGYRW